MSRNESPRFAHPALLMASLLFATLAPDLAVGQGELTVTKDQQQIAAEISEYLQRWHIRKRALDDELSAEFFEAYLETLDPLRLFFRKADIDEFAKRKTDLDDLLKKGEFAFAKKVFDRFLERVDERVAWVEKLLERDFDFDKEESILKDRSEASYPQTAEEQNETWRKYVKLLVLQGLAADEEEAKIREQIGKRYRSLKKRMHQTDMYELIEMYLTSGTMLYDPHTTYMSPDTLESFEISMRLELEGIGAALSSIDGYTTVTQIIPGGAADRDGRLQVGDKITAVGQDEEGDFEDVVDRKLRDVVKLIRGKKGTTVRLQVTHEKDDSRELLVLERAKVKLTDREARSTIIQEGIKPDGSPQRVGVIDLPSFYMDMAAAQRGETNFKSTSRDVEKILEGFREEKVDAVLIDLRENGGGALSEAIRMTGLFIDHGPIVQIKNPTGSIEKEYDREEGMAWDGPLVVLVSKFSASASEIFAGAIQDYSRGLVVGDSSTHGKGTVQRLIDIGRRGGFRSSARKLGALKMTISKFYRPTGASTQNRGVVPDITLPSVANHMDIGEANLDNAIEFDTIPAAPFDKLERIDAEMVAALAAASELRRGGDEEFGQVKSDIERYLKLKAEKWTSLNKAKFFENYKIVRDDEEEDEQSEDDLAAGDETSEEKDAAAEDEPIVLRDFYFDEVLAITLDYVRVAS